MMDALILFVFYFVFIHLHLKSCSILSCIFGVVGILINASLYFHSLIGLVFVLNLSLFFFLISRKIKEFIIIYLLIIINYSAYLLLQFIEFPYALELVYFSSILMVFVYRNIKKTSILYLCLQLLLFSVVSCLCFERSILYYVILLLLYFAASRNQFYMRKTYEQQFTEYQVETMTKHAQEVETIYETMRGWRHDFHNHIQKLKAHLAMQNYESMNDYLSELDQDLTSIETFIHTRNTHVDAIINSKLSLAKSKRIAIDITVNIPNQLKVQDVDLCVVIGNLLDNAIQACEAIECEARFIRIYMGIFKKQLYISVANSTSEMTRKKVFELTTRKQGDHGHGLKRINQVVTKYQGYINRQNEPGVFVTEIMLPN